MYEGKRICVVVPAHNEARMIGRVLSTLPSFVDDVVIVDDGSLDGTSEVARRALAGGGDGGREGLVFRHHQNRGVGAAISTGYRLSLERSAEVVVVMAGDGQMDPRDLEAVVAPVARGEADYAKGNRLTGGFKPPGMPLHRYIGVEVLTRLTRLAAGYRELEDAQSGYTAASSECLEALPLERLYPRYGYPNHLLILLGASRQRVLDVPVRPVYGQGEASELRCARVAPRLLWLLGSGYLWRLRQRPRERT